MSKDLGLTVKKSENFSEWYWQIVRKAELADVRYGVQGFIVHRPWGFRILRKIYEFLEKEAEAKGHEPALFPLVVAGKNLEKEKEHIAGFSPELYWLNTAEGEESLALRPTSETIMYPMYSLWIRSYKDLPLKIYQSRICVYRNESTTLPFLRGKEFMFFETHNVFKDQESVQEQITEDMAISKHVIYDKCLVPFIFFQRPQWDKFAGAEETYACDSILPNGKASQLSSTHDLGQGFAKAFNIVYEDERGEKKYAYQTCFGPGIWRIMASIITLHADDSGLVLPPEIAPIKTVVIPISKKGEAEIRNYVKEVASIFSEGYLDDSDNTPGFKFNKWELLGVPIRLEIGSKELAERSVTVYRRDTGEKSSIRFSDAERVIPRLYKEITDNLRKKAETFSSKKAHLYEDLKGLIENKSGFVKVNFCHIDQQGEQCAEKIEKELKAKVLGVPFAEKEQPDGPCIVCGKKANHVAYVAKAY